MEAELDEDVQGHTRIPRIRFVEGLVEDDRAVLRDRLIRVGELIAQRCRQAEDHELLLLTTGHRRTRIVGGMCTTMVVDLLGEEAHVQACVQALSLPDLVDVLAG